MLGVGSEGCDQSYQRHISASQSRGSPRGIQGWPSLAERRSCCSGGLQRCPCRNFAMCRQAPKRDEKLAGQCTIETRRRRPRSVLTRSETTGSAPIPADARSHNRAASIIVVRRRGVPERRDLVVAPPSDRHQSQRPPARLAPLSALRRPSSCRDCRLSSYVRTRPGRYTG